MVKGLVLLADRRVSAPTGGADPKAGPVNSSIVDADIVTAAVLLDSLEPHWAATLLCVEWGWDRAFWALSRVHHEAAQEAMFTAMEWLMVENTSLS